MAVMKPVIGIGFGAEVPVVSPRWAVISLLNTLAPVSFAVVGVMLGSTAMIIAAMVVGGSGSVPIDLLARSMHRRRHFASWHGTAG